MIDHTHVPGIHDEGLVVLLIDGEILAGPLFLHQRILIAAGLGAHTALRVPVRHVIGQEAPPGIAHAHGPVDKGLDLQGGRCPAPDLPDFLQGELPGQDDPAGPQLMPRPGRLVIADPRLGGDMELEPGGVPLRQAEDSQVRHDGGIYGGVQIFQPLGQAIHLAAAGHGVACHMDGHAVPMAERHRLPKPFPVKIAGKCSHPEIIPRQIDRIRPVGHGHA